MKLISIFSPDSQYESKQVCFSKMSVRILLMSHYDGFVMECSFGFGAGFDI